jgi:hypothetical protein
MPSMRSRLKGPKKGKETYFGYSRRHQVHMNFQPLSLKSDRKEVGILGTKNLKFKSLPFHNINDL